MRDLCEGFQVCLLGEAAPQAWWIPEKYMAGYTVGSTAASDHRIVGAKKYALEGACEGLSIASARANNEGAKAKITS